MGVGGSSPSAPTICLHIWWPRGTSVPRVRRLCERPGCAAPADVSYGIDKIALTVWVDNRAIPEREHAGRLCRRHANALIVPRGWTLDDRRESIPRLFKALAEEVAAQGNNTKRKSKPKRKAVEPPLEPPTLFEASTPTSVVESPRNVDPDETQAIPWSPRLSSVSRDEEDDAPVFGRLLGRAFGQRAADEDNE